MPALVGSKGRPRDNEQTRSGRKHIQRLLGTSVTLLENIIGDGTLEYNGAKLEDRRKTAQYIIDQNVGRAAFTVHGQLDIHKQEVVFAAFLAGGIEMLPEVDQRLITGDPGPVPVESTALVVAEEAPQGTEPCDDLL